MKQAKEYTACISYGKDSLAMLEIISKNRLPLTRIVHVEVMATDTIPADLPEVVEWKHHADKIINQRYGLKVEHIRADKTYEQLFYKIPQRKAKNKHFEGDIRGFPLLKGQWCSQELKTQVIDRLKSDVRYIGIAADEPTRQKQLSEKVRSPLVEFNVTEAECLKICKDIGLLAPTYLQSKRNGCWFCHAQPIDQLRLLRKQHPNLWAKLLEFDRDSPVPFKQHERNRAHTVKDFDERFELEDKGVIQAGDRKFKWAKMEHYKGQIIEPCFLTKKGAYLP